MVKVNRFNNSKIYRLYPKIINEDNKTLFYYGYNSGKSLDFNLMNYISNYKYKIKPLIFNNKIINNGDDNLSDNYKTSYKLFDKYGINGVNIELIKIHNCKNQYELDEIFLDYINNNDCVNKDVKYITINEKCKKYYEKNKDLIAEKHKIYYENNKDKIIDYHKQYRENNKDDISLREFKYRQNNREKINE